MYSCIPTYICDCCTNKDVTKAQQDETSVKAVAESSNRTLDLILSSYFSLFSFLCHSILLCSMVMCACGNIRCRTQSKYVSSACSLRKCGADRINIFSFRLYLRHKFAFLIFSIIANYLKYRYLA